MWFWFAIIALLCWSGSDLFSKIGCRGNDKYAHLKMVIAVGVVMGLHAAFEIFVQGTSVTWHIIWTYLPVSLLYIVSMALGYVGLRYIELSISSPICNSSGALVAVLCLITGTLDESIQGGMRVAVIGAVALVCIGVIGLGVVESREDDELRQARQAASNYKYAKSWLAICLPVAYCLLDAAGTFADSLVLDRLSTQAFDAGMFATFDECSDYAASAANCAVCWVGEDSLLFYASGVVPTSNTRNLQRQAWLSTDKGASLAVARAFFAKRFPDAELEGKTLQEMMGMEGLRVRNFYLEKAEQYKVGWKGRVFTPGKFELSDLTNQILTSTNAALYGVLCSCVTYPRARRGNTFLQFGPERFRGLSPRA